jgi:hypothetical protein
LLRNVTLCILGGACIASSASALELNLRKGWNLIGVTEVPIRGERFPFPDSIDNIFTYYYKKVGSKWRPKKKTDVDIKKEGLEVSAGRGYWIKVSKLVLTAQTSDGVTINFYADSESDKLPDNLKEQIAGKTYKELKNSFPTLGTFNGEVVVAVKDPVSEEAKEMAPVSVVNGNVAVSDLPSKEQIDTELDKLEERLAIYVYGIEPGSAPKILAGAKVYYLDDEGNEVYVGTTDARGYLLPKDNDGQYVDLKGKTIIVRSSQYGESELEVPQSASGAYYALIYSQQFAGATRTVSLQGNERLQRVSNVWEYATDKVAIHYNEMQVNVPFDWGVYWGQTATYLSSEKFKEALEEDNSQYTVITPITTVKFFVKRTEDNKRLYGEKLKFSYLLKDSSPDKIIIDVSPDKSGVYEFNGIAIEEIMQKLNTDSKYRPRLEAWFYKDKKWQKLGEVKIKEVSESDPWRSYLGRKYYVELPEEKVGVGKDYDGFYPIAIVYREPKVVEATLYVTVRDEKTKRGIENALVAVGGKTAVTNEEGKVSIPVSISAQGSLIPVTVTHPKYIKKVTSVDPASMIENRKGELSLELTPVPDTATITGEVVDADSKAGVSNAKVELINPISLDEAKIATRGGIKGIEIGLDPSATYTWFIRKKSEKAVERGGIGYLPRTAEGAWMVVKEGKGRDGNFLSFNEILAKILKDDESIPDNIGTTYGVSDAVAGVFEIAVKVAHDVNSDGNPDYVEFAKGDVDTILYDNGTSEQIPQDIKLYAKKIGELKVTIDVDKLAESSSNAKDCGHAVYKIGDKYYYTDTDYDEEGNEVDVLYDENKQEADDNISRKYVNYELAIGGGSKFRAFRIEGWNTEYLSKNSELDWNVFVVADIKDKNDNLVASVVLDKDGNWNKLPEEYEQMTEPEKVKQIFSQDSYKVAVAGKFAFDKDGNMIYSDNVVSFMRLVKSLADDKIIRALAKTIGEVANEAGISKDNLEVDKQMIADGVQIVLVPHITYYVDNETVDVYLHTNGLGLKAEKGINEVLSISDIAVEPIAQIDSRIVTYSDRVGEFSFPRVPYDFSKLEGTDLSLLRLRASRFDYYPSNYQVIPAFSPQEGQYTVVHQILSMEKKEVHTLTLNLSVDGNSTAEALAGVTITVTGVKDAYGGRVTYKIDQNGNLEKVSGGEGAARIIARRLPRGGKVYTFELLEGKQKIIVKKEGYQPYTKTINVDKNLSINVDLKPAPTQADFAPVVSINVADVDYARRKVIVSGKVFDRENGGISDTLEMYVIVNGKPVSARVEIDKAEGTFFVSFEPPEGENEIEIVAVNDKGETHNTRFISYYPNVGNIEGNVIGCDGGDFVAQLLNKEGEVIEVTTPEQKTGNFYFFNVPVGEYMVGGLCYDASGRSYKAEVVKIELDPGEKEEVTLQVNENATYVEGPPVVEITQIPQGVEIDEDGDWIIKPEYSQDTLKIIAEVDNFDYDDDVSERFAVVLNDQPIEVKPGEFTHLEGDNYTFEYDLPINKLVPGTNVLYLVAVNKNGEIDFSDDLYIINRKGESEKKSINLEFVNEERYAVEDDYFYVDIYDENNNLITHALSKYQGNNNYVELRLAPGVYEVNIYSQNDEYVELNAKLEVLSDGEVKLDGKTLTDSDSDKYLEISMVEYSQNENLPPTISVLSNRFTLLQDNTVEVAYVNDPNDDDVKVNIESSDENVVEASYDETTGTVTVKGKSPGTATITITADDGNGGTASATIEVTVTPAESGGSGGGGGEQPRGLEYPPQPGNGSGLVYPPNPSGH